jgi:hypothetical protein
MNIKTTNFLELVTEILQEEVLRIEEIITARKFFLQLIKENNLYFIRYEMDTVVTFMPRSRVMDFMQACHDNMGDEVFARVVSDVTLPMLNSFDSHIVRVSFT